MAKWRNFTLRSNAAGSWALVDPSDADNTTTVIYSGADPVYTDGVLSSDGVNVYGRFHNAQTFANTSQANAASDPLLSGRLGLTSQWVYQIDAQAGDYDLRMAFGAGTAGTLRNVLAVFSGTATYVESIITSGSAAIWTASAAHSLNTFMISKTDKSVWKCTTAGTASTTEPSGAGPTFNDGTIVWTRQTIDAMHIIDGSTTSASIVVDQNSAADISANWQSKATVTVTVVGGASGNAFTLMRLTNATTYLKQFSVRLQQPTLVDVVISDDKDVVVTGAPSTYAAQPAGHRTWKIQTSSGASDPTAFTLTGDLAAYFEPVTFESAVWLTTKALRIPESLVGTRSLTIRQTDVDAVVTTHDTVLSVDVVSAEGRPEDGSMLGRVWTQTFVRRKAILAATVMWPGYVSQSFAMDLTATSKADIETALATIGTPDGTSWYRIKLQNGTYTGTINALVKDFGAGGLLIEPDTGHDPEWNIALTGSCKIHGLNVRGLQIPGIVALMGSQLIVFRLTDPGASGILGGGRSNKLKVNNCRLGAAFGDGVVLPSDHSDPTPGTDPSDDPDEDPGSTILISVNHGDSVEVVDCFFDGSSGVYISGVEQFSFTDNDYQRPLYDMLKIGQQEATTSTPQPVTNSVVARNVFRHENDIIERGTEPHVDFVQLATPLGNISSWFANKGAYVNIPTPNGLAWYVGQQVIKTGAGGGVYARIYECVASTGSGYAGATGPTGTSNGQVDGDVTWDYVVDYAGGIVTNLLMEDNTAQSTLLNGERSGVQMLIDSTGGFDNEVNVVAINNSLGTNSGRGFEVHTGELIAEFNTCGFPMLSADYAATGDFVRATVFVTSGYLLTHNNILGTLPVESDAETKAALYGDIIVDWLGSATAPDRPEDILNGPFTLQDKIVDTWSYPTLDDSGTNTTAEFAAEQRTILGALTSWMGAQSGLVTDPEASEGGGRWQRMSLGLGLSL